MSISTISKSTSILSSRQVKDYWRYGIWLGLAGTANANRHCFGLVTTWLPHLIGNTIALLLPDIYRLVEGRFGLEQRLNRRDYPTAGLLRLIVERLVRDNPDYVAYVAPAALAYIVSHPRFNIYRGRLGRLKLLGFGLDSIPHSATAYALSNFAYDALAELEKNAALSPGLEPYLKRLASRKTVVTAGFIAALTLVYEAGEYYIHRSELKARDNDPSRINMMWSVEDTIFDGLSNMIGWALSTWRHRLRRD